MMDLRPLQPSAFRYRTILSKENAIASHFEQPATVADDTLLGS